MENKCNLIFLLLLFYSLFSSKHFYDSTVILANRARRKISVKETVVFFNISPQNLIYYIWLEWTWVVEITKPEWMLKWTLYYKDRPFLLMGIACSNHLRRWRIIISFSNFVCAGWHKKSFAYMCVCVCNLYLEKF